MTPLIYKVTGARLGAEFEFDLIIEDGNSIRRNEGTWRMPHSSGLGTLASRLTRGGKWKYKAAPTGEGYLFLKSSPARPPFDIALDQVPFDYIHGPFCSVAAGKGTLSASAEEDVKIHWEIAGPGCV